MKRSVGKVAGLNVNVGRLSPGAAAPTVLITAQDRDGSKLWKAIGTGFPVFHNGLVLIVTAAHNFRGMTDEPVVLIGAKGQIRLFRDNCHFRGSSAVDIAFLALNSEDLISLFGECNCVELDWKALPERTAAHIYQAYGYPSSKNKHSGTLGWSMEEFRVTLGQSIAVPLRSKLHELEVPLLGFDIDLSEMLNDDGKRDTRLGKLDGISGGPVIAHAIDNGEIGPGKVAGIFLEWHKNEKVAVVMPAMAIAAAIQVWFSNEVAG